MKPKSALWRFLTSIAACILLFILVTNVLVQPVAGETRTYSAEFTDASGLHANDDVRVSGVRVGKVKSVALERRAGQSVAAVEFSLDKHYAVVSETRLAIKFQALTGLRYVDVVNSSEAESAVALVTNIPTSMTRPSFDITSLFNGLQPVLATLSPEEVNTFTENAATYLSGDGSGLGPLLDSIRTLTEFVSDRQKVVATVMHNLNDLSGVVGGHSNDLIQVLDWVNRPLDAAIDVLDEFRKSDLYGPQFTGAVVKLLTNMGIRPGIDVDDAFDRAITALYDNIDAVKRVPVVWGNIGGPAAADEPLHCSRGPAQLPATMDVLLNGQKVVLCHQ